jgi:hypothetical protein
VYLHGKKGLGKKDEKCWCYDKILVHLKEFGPTNTQQEAWTCLTFRVNNLKLLKKKKGLIILSIMNNIVNVVTMDIANYLLVHIIIWLYRMTINDQIGKVHNMGVIKPKISSCGIQKSHKMPSKHQRKYSYPNRKV